MSVSYFSTHQSKRSRRNQRWLGSIALFAFLVQALIPTGYMPASLAEDGSFIKFCPKGVSPSLMARLHQTQNAFDTSSDMTGDMSHHAHHHHMHHDVSVASEQNNKHNEHAHHDHAESGWQEECSYGLAQSGSDAILIDFPSLTHESSTRYLQQLQIAEEILARLHRKQQQRAPPTPLV